jgi:uncharacterized surface protein with fasciclin (FAS1) repeats
MFQATKSTKKKRSTLAITGVFIGSLLFAGCFNNDDDSSDNNPMQNNSPGTITDVAISNPQFSTLTTALTAAGLEDDLAGAGPFTVFAPTNAAFEALPEGTLAALLQEPEGDLKNILLYHVVGGSFKAADVVGLERATSLEGRNIAIKVADGKVMLNQNATVVATDIEASNGIIHVIDAVILPPAPPKPTIKEMAVNNPDFSTLVAALQAAKLDGAMDGAGPFTVFAPTNAAFEALPAGTLEALLKDPEGDLKSILLYHVVGGSFKAADVVGLERATSLEGRDIAIKVADGKVMLNQSATVVTTDIEASNGIIHVIDAVILPPAQATQ